MTIDGHFGAGFDSNKRGGLSIDAAGDRILHTVE